MDRACLLAKVSRAGYYRAWQESEPKQAETDLRDRVQRICLEHRLYGSRRVARRLQIDGIQVGRKRVQRLMREDNLLALRKRRFVVTTESKHAYAVYHNQIREFKATGINQLWVADLTYIRVRETFLYLAIILDAFSRRVVGWALGNTLEAELAVAALRQALTDREVPAGIIHHSDRGIQYCAHAYVEQLKAAEFVISMSRSGNPYDNAMAESFMRTLKCEEVYLNQYRDLEDARERIGQFLEDYYNRKRLHSSLNYQSPVDFEEGRA